MADPISEGIPKEARLFPITNQATERALSDLATDPKRGIILEDSIMLADHSSLDQWIQRRARSEPQFPSLTYGALICYKILRTQAETNGGRLLQISQSAMDTYTRDLLEDAKNRGRAGSSETMGEMTERRSRRLREEEPMLGQALEEVSKYNPEKLKFWEGAVEVYYIFKNVEETRKVRDVYNK